MRILLAYDVSGSMNRDNILTNIKNYALISGEKYGDIVYFNAVIEKHEMGINLFSASYAQYGLPGGTDVQCVIDFAATYGYDKVFIFSDGYYPPFNKKGIEVVEIELKD